MTRETIYASIAMKSVLASALDPGLEIAPNAGTLEMDPIVSENAPFLSTGITGNASLAMKIVFRAAPVRTTSWVTEDVNHVKKRS